MTNPFVMGAIAGISYFAGLKQNGNSNDSFEGLKDQIGEVNHITMVGDKGTFDCEIRSYWVRDGEEAKAMRGTLKTNKNETKMAYDYGTNDGILKTSDGTSMYVNSGEWVQGDLTKAQEEFLNGKSNDFLQVRSFMRKLGKEKLSNDQSNAGLKENLNKVMEKMKAHRR